MSKQTTFDEKTAATFKNKEIYKGKYAGMFPFEFDSTPEGEAEDATVVIPTDIHLIPIGEWMHDAYGPISITKSDLREFMQNFNAKVRKGVFITAGHEGFQELPAVGWITALEMRDTGLWGSVEWNESGIELLSDKAFKFFSPEFYRDYEDPQTHQIYRNVLTGGALTKSPYFKELEAIVFSDKNIKSNFNTSTMNLAEILAKDITTLTVEEKAFVKENAAQLTEEQKTAYTAIIDAPVEEATAATEEAKVEEAPAEEAKPAEEAPAVEETPAETAPVVASDKMVKCSSCQKTVASAKFCPECGAKMSGKEVAASEQSVSMNSAEVEALKLEATKGAAAFAELKAIKLSNALKGLMFSEDNKSGKFLPKSADNLRAFAETLNEAQLATFSDLINQLPTLEIFREVGASEAFNDATAVAQVETLVNAKMTSNKGMKYSDALKSVFSENKELETRYLEEVSK